MRDAETMVRRWAIPGDEHGRPHRIGGLEKDFNTGAISTDPANHERMVNARREKIAKIANDIPALEVMGSGDADTLLVGWGGTYGHLRTAAAELNDEGCKIDFAHFRYINPLPANTGEVLSRYKRVIVAELNTGQFADYLQSRFAQAHISRINKVQGQPFMVGELKDRITEIIDNKL